MRDQSFSLLLSFLFFSLFSRVGHPHLQWEHFSQLIHRLWLMEGGAGAVGMLARSNQGNSSSLQHFCKKKATENKVHSRSGEIFSAV